MARLLTAAVLLPRALGSYELIASYAPSTDVVSHSMIDMDQAEVDAAVVTYDFDEAMRVYEYGGGGLCDSTDITTSDVDSACYPANGGAVGVPRGNSVKSSGSIRTLKGFATSGASKMSAEKHWNLYKNYWQDDDYADTFVTGAYADSGMDDSMKAELIKKGVAYQATWMYVIHEFEDAIFDCLNGDIYDNEETSSAGDSPHAWDEGWAFYAGSNEGTDGSGTGSNLYALAEKRCADYGTCSEGRTGTATANDKALELADLGRDMILLGGEYCSQVNDVVVSIVHQMTVPLVQGMLKYVFKADPKNQGGSCTSGSCPKEWAEGWAFAAAVLPQINYCSPTTAAMIVANLDTANAEPMGQDGWEYLKTQVEKTYDCLGITCVDVGNYQNSAGSYWDACLDSHAEIALYEPTSNVVPHSKIDMDQAEIDTAVGVLDFDEAMRVYEYGGGGACDATDVLTTDPDSACLPANGGAVGTPKGNSVKSSGAIRTLKGFATAGDAKMGKTGDYAEHWFPIYKAYWGGDEDYADTFVMSAYADSSMDDAMKAELIKKGVAYQANWMYVLHEFEDAIGDCLGGDIWDNEATNDAGASPHAWDEGWAFYAGSREGADGSGSGSALHALAEKRCADYGTCADTGAASANTKALAYAKLGRDKLLAEDCVGANVELELIRAQMTVPLVQGMLKYAYKSDESCDAGCPKEWAEGWAFAAAVLPQIDQCDEGVASMIASNLDIANAEPMANNGWEAFKASVETTYACLGITCADVGAYQNSAGLYWEACTDGTISGGGSSSSKTTTKFPVGLIVILAVIALILLLCTLALFAKLRKTEEKLYQLVGQNNEKNNML